MVSAGAGRPARAGPGESPAGAGFGALLRGWRMRRGYSQLRLAMEADVSARHISFLENDRSSPGRDMVMRLIRVLDIPAPHRNVLFVASGYAPMVRDRPLDDPELATVRRAFDYMLAQQEPFPGVLVDRLWNLRGLNAAAADFFRWLFGLPVAASIPVDGSLNVLLQAADPAGLRPFIGNAGAVVRDMAGWVEREMADEGPAGGAARLLARLHEIEGVAHPAEPGTEEAAGLPVMPVVIRKGGQELNLFTTLTALGAPRDAGLHGLRLEAFFPMDAETEAWFRRRAHRIAACQGESRAAG